MIDLIQYPSQKAEGLVAVVKIGVAYAISKRTFDPGTGKELAPEVAAIALEDVDKNIATLQTQIAALQQLKSDLEALG